MIAGTSRLEITFETAGIREICEKRTVATTELGYAGARELAERLADIDAVDTASELSEMLGPAISDRSSREKCLHLSAGYNLILRSAHPLPPDKVHQATDWENTTRMKIMAIERIDG